MNKWTNEQWKTDDNDVHIGDIIWLSYVREVSEDRDDVVGEILEDCIAVYHQTEHKTVLKVMCKCWRCLGNRMGM